MKHTRWALVKDPGALSTDQRLTLERLRRSRSVLWRAWAMKEALRDVFRLRELGAAHQFLDRWLAWACRSRIPAFVRLSRTIRAHREGILAAVELGLSNSKLEGLNSKIRLINHRGAPESARREMRRSRTTPGQGVEFLDVRPGELADRRQTRKRFWVWPWSTRRSSMSCGDFWKIRRSDSAKPQRQATRRWPVC